MTGSFSVALIGFSAQHSQLQHTCTHTHALVCMLGQIEPNIKHDLFYPLVQY